MIKVMAILVVGCSVGCANVTSRLSLKPDTNAPNPSVDLISSADQMHDAGRYAEALKIYAQVKAAPPSSYSEQQVRVASRIAECQYALGRYAEALASFDDLLAKCPHGARKYAPDLHRSDCLAILGKTNEAIRSYAFVNKNYSTNYHVDVQSRMVGMARKRSALITGVADSNATLRVCVSKSDLVVYGTILSEPEPEDAGAGSIKWRFKFTIKETLHGEKPELDTLDVTLLRFKTHKEDHPSYLARDSECILFLQNANARPDGLASKESPVWQSSDKRFGIQPYEGMLAQSIQELSEARKRRWR